MAYEHIERIATSNSYNTKAKGKRKKRTFKVRARKRGFTPELFDRDPYLLSEYVKQLPEHMKATTARNNDGMSVLW